MTRPGRSRNRTYSRDRPGSDNVNAPDPCRLEPNSTSGLVPTRWACRTVCRVPSSWLSTSAERPPSPAPSPDGTGSRLMIGCDAGPFTDPDAIRAVIGKVGCPMTRDSGQTRMLRGRARSKGGHDLSVRRYLTTDPGEAPYRHLRWVFPGHVLTRRKMARPHTQPPIHHLQLAQRPAPQRHRRQTSTDPDDPWMSVAP